jgi:hypothetical protein
MSLPLPVRRFQDSVHPQLFDPLVLECLFLSSEVSQLSVPTAKKTGPNDEAALGVSPAFTTPNLNPIDCVGDVNGVVNQP